MKFLLKQVHPQQGPVESSEVEVASGRDDSRLDVPVDDGLDAEEAYRSSVKRPADVDVDTLEQEIREEAILNISSLLDSGFFDADSGQPILSSVFSSLEAPASFLHQSFSWETWTPLFFMERKVISQLRCSLVVQRC